MFASAALSPLSDSENEDRFLSFAKRSRTVERRCEERNPFQHLHERPFLSTHYTEKDWDGPLHQFSTGFPSSHYKLPVPEGFNDPPMHQRDGVMGPGPTPLYQSLQNLVVDQGRLPSPSELMGRRRKTRDRGANEHRVTAVVNHIRELKKKQGIIDQLKKEKWSGSTDTCRAEEPGCGYLPGGGDSSSHTLPSYYHEVSYRDADGLPSLAPGGNPMMSFVMATADRQTQDAHAFPCISSREFWGFHFNAEE